MSKEYNTFYCPVQARRIQLPFFCDYGGTIYDCPFFRARDKMFNREKNRERFRVGYVIAENFEGVSYSPDPALGDFMRVREFKKDYVIMKKIDLKTSSVVEEKVIRYNNDD